MTDTIFALATARGRSGVAVVRVSGWDVFDHVSPYLDTVPKNRGLRRIRDRDGEILDEALVLSFPKGKSFTGEPVVEFHLHGSPAVISAVLGAFLSDPRMREAEPGEFTRRALENGRLDLAQVEGLADLIEAETEAQRRQALRVFGGALGQLAESWRASLIRAAALIETTIDFADEDVPDDVIPDVSALLAGVKAEMAAQVDGVKMAERVRDGFEVAILGRPNVGKSTLLNRLAGRDAAITSEIAGTTRDVIEVRMSLNGLPVTILDTAGLREADNDIERQGVERAIQRAQAADLRVVLTDGGEMPEIALRVDDIVVQAKSDLVKRSGLSVSGVTGEGVDRLVGLIGERLSELSSGAGVAIRARHGAALGAGVGLIGEAETSIEMSIGLDLVAETLRRAIRSVDMIVGRVDVEDLLDDIFSSFCIGK